MFIKLIDMVLAVNKTMKNSILILCILLTTLLSFGQQNKDSVLLKQNSTNEISAKHQYHKMFGITFQLNNLPNDEFYTKWFNRSKESINNSNKIHKSYSIGLLANYNLSDEVTLRFRYGLTNYFIERYYYYPDRRYNGYLKEKQTIIQFAPGIVGKINENKLSFFGGIEIPYNLIGEYSEISYTIDNNDHSLSNKRIITIPKQSSYGVGVLIGFNYFPVKWLSIGSEFSPSIQYSKQSGIIRTVYVGDKTIESKLSEKGYSFYDHRFSLNLAIWL
jgi:hypothetical protein